MYTSPLGLDRFMASALRYCSALRRKAHGDDDPGAKFLYALAVACKDRERPGVVDVSWMSAEDRATVTGALLEALERARLEGDSSWNRLLYVHDSWAHFMRTARRHGGERAV